MSEQLLQRLDRIETLLEQLIGQRTVKDWYTVAEVAEMLGRAEFTVREWCRLGRVYASKRDADAAEPRNGSSHTKNSRAFGTKAFSRCSRAPRRTSHRQSLRHGFPRPLMSPWRRSPSATQPFVSVGPRRPTGWLPAAGSESGACTVGPSLRSDGPPRR